jgi:hypothetical protein
MFWPLASFLFKAFFVFMALLVLGAGLFVMTAGGINILVGLVVVAVASFGIYAIIFWL